MKKYQEIEQPLRDKFADSYEQWYLKSKGKWFDLREKNLFLKVVKKRKFKNVLDLGSGTGRITETISPYVDHVTAVDFSSKSLEILQSKKLQNVDVKKVDIVSGLPFKNESFDLICSCQVVQHLYIEDLLKVLKECNRVLMPGGQFIFSVYNLGLWKDRNIVEKIYENGLYCKRFTPHYIYYLSAQSNFIVAQIKYYGIISSSLVQLEKFHLFVQLFDKLLCVLPIINIFFAGYLFCVLQKRQ